MRAAFIHSSELERYSYPPDCPFRTDRAALARRALVSMGLLGGPDRVEVPPRAARREELLAFPTERYLRALEDAEGGSLDVEALRMGLGTAQTPIFPGLYAYAALAVGGGGYHLQSTVRGWSLAWSVLCGEQEACDAIGLGLGGVMLETTDWQGGLRENKAMLAVFQNCGLKMHMEFDGSAYSIQLDVTRKAD